MTSRQNNALEKGLRFAFDSDFHELGKIGDERACCGDGADEREKGGDKGEREHAEETRKGEMGAFPTHHDGFVVLIVTFEAKQMHKFDRWHVKSSMQTPVWPRQSVHERLPLQVPSTTRRS